MVRMSRDIVQVGVFYNHPIKQQINPYKDSWDFSDRLVFFPFPTCILHTQVSVHTVCVHIVHTVYIQFFSPYGILNTAICHLCKNTAPLNVFVNAIKLASNLNFLICFTCLMFFDIVAVVYYTKTMSFSLFFFLCLCVALLAKGWSNYNRTCIICTFLHFVLLFYAAFITHLTNVFYKWLNVLEVEKKMLAIHSLLSIFIICGQKTVPVCLIFFMNESS